MFSVKWKIYLYVQCRRLSVLNPRSDPSPVHVRSLLDKVAPWRIFLPLLHFSPVSIIPPMLHTHSFTYIPHYIMFLSQYFSFPCQYHSTNAPYPFIHLPPTLYNVSLPVLQFSPVSTIPPTLHTHSFTYHPRYIMFLSQYFSFPLSVPFHQCSVPIHSITTHTIKCFSPSTSVFPCQYHSTNAP